MYRGDGFDARPVKLLHRVGKDLPVEHRQSLRQQGLKDTEIANLMACWLAVVAAR